MNELHYLYGRSENFLEIFYNDKFSETYNNNSQLNSCPYEDGDGIGIPIVHIETYDDTLLGGGIGNEKFWAYE